MVYNFWAVILRIAYSEMRTQVHTYHTIFHKICTKMLRRNEYNIDIRTLLLI